jgi:hypothetical protein
MEFLRYEKNQLQAIVELRKLTLSRETWCVLFKRFKRGRELFERVNKMSLY